LTDTRLTPETGRLEVKGQQAFFIREVRSIADLRAAISEMGPVGSLAFRGYYVPQEDDPTARPALTTGLERVCREIDGALHNARPREVAIVREFMRRAHHYLPDVPGNDNWFEWLALMQHHGAPTRLLDWTYSPPIAVHFALSHASRQPNTALAVWMVNTEWCANASASVCAAAGYRVGNLIQRPLRRKTEPDASRELLAGPSPACVWPINPFRLNERLTLQRGLFLATGDVGRSFAENLAELPGHENPGHVTYFQLPRAESANLTQELYESNVTDATLFPGLDGFAKSLWTASRFLDITGLRTFRDL
jgi:hypothetical protein